MVPPARAGTFSPSPAQSLQTGVSHPPHSSQNSALSASPVTGSPTGGTSSLSKIVIAQVFVLLSSIKEEKDDPSKWEQLRKLIDESGMEVFTKYFARLVASCASQIFPGLNRPGGSAGSYQLLTAEMQKISRDLEQAHRIAESIEIGTEDIFRDFDLSTFMEHFKLNALEKTILALAFKQGPRSDLKTKADAILSTNFPSFANILARADGDEDYGPDFISVVVDRFIQLHPPNFNAAARSELAFKVGQRYDGVDLGPPLEILAALDLIRVLTDKPANALSLYIHKTGSDFTRDEDTCVTHLQNRPFSSLTEEQVSIALTYTTVSQTFAFSPSTLVAALRRVLPASFRWQDVVDHFDQRGVRVSPPQFLRLYNALVPIARNDANALDIQRLWGGSWENPETQLAFVCAFASLTPEQLDTATIPGIQPTIAIDEYTRSHTEIQARASEAAKHPLVSLAAISAIIQVALHSQHASTNVEARRLFQSVVIPNLDIFVVSAFGVPKPWPATAVETINSVFEDFLYKRQPNWEFVFNSLWRKDKTWVVEKLIETHAAKPGDLPIIFEHAVKQGWLDELIHLPNGFGLDLMAYAYDQDYVDLAEWAKANSDRAGEVARRLVQFLVVKSDQLDAQRSDNPLVSAKAQVPLKIRTVSALLGILEDFLPKITLIPDLVLIQRQCIAIYPRLINFGEGYDDIIELNERESHTLPSEANAKMEEHFKKMYGNEIEVRAVVGIMEHYKHSRDALDQDVFACMINSLFEEYSHFGDYPLEALATTSVLFGGLISHKLIADVPLRVGLGMILEAVRDHTQEHPMYKFGMQALMQLYSRFREWPGFCSQLLRCASLNGTEASKKAEEVVRENGGDDEIHTLGPHTAGSAVGGEPLTNGNVEDPSAEQHFPPFVSLNVDPPPPDAQLEDPSGDAQGKIQFVLNNITANTLQAMFVEIRPMLEAKHQQWFASHLVEQRAKMQPNYHKVYLQLVSQFDDKALWAEVLRETYVSVFRMLNSEATLQNSTERTHLKNLGGWLGLLTLARDKPIRHKNIAFKQLLVEAYTSKRLIVVIPFVCKVLSQGEHSNVFKPPNPWLMDIIHFLIDLYHNAELKLNLKFEIEVLCQTLSIDHKSIEPSGEILNRVALEEAAEPVMEPLDAIDTLSLNGLAHAGVEGGMSAHGMVPNVVSSNMVAMIPDVINKVHIPPVSEMVISASRLEEIVRLALVRALQDIIQPVVDRSVAIAAIATQQMIHKDFATEPDEGRVRDCAINMVKATAGSLALVTSKEPLRANFTNYIRTFSSDLPQGLPEGTIIMCVNSNLDYASGVIEKATEDRAVMEIEDMIEPEIEARRRHRLQRPNEPYIDPSLSRWAMTIPNPFKLNPTMTGLNPEQMEIYEDFARQSRPVVGAVSSSAAHAPSASDATRSLANEVLQDQYSSLPTVSTPAGTPSVVSVASQMQPYAHVHGSIGGTGVAGPVVNGRQAGPNMDLRALMERVQKLVMELQRLAIEATEEHFSELPRPHPVLDVVDALVQTFIKAQQTAEEFAVFAAEQVCQILFSSVEDSLALESAVHVLETMRKIAGPPLSNRVSQYFHSQPGQSFLHLPLISALLGTDLLDWPSVDNAMAAALKQRKEGSIIFLMRLLDLALIGDTPLALYADFVNSLAEAWAWVGEEPDVPGGQEFKAKVLAPVAQSPPPSSSQEPLSVLRKDQLEYVFEEWVHLCQKPNVPESIPSIFVEQMRARCIVASREDLYVFLRIAVDKSVEHFEANLLTGGQVVDGFAAIDAVAKLVAVFVQGSADEEGSSGELSVRTQLLDSVLALSIMLVNHHAVKRGELFNRKVFFRLFSMLLFAINNISDQLSDTDRSEIILRFAVRFNDLGPSMFPFFAFPWFELVKHRIFMPTLLRMPGGAGWPRFTQILKQLLGFVGEQLKLPDAPAFARELYRAALKLLLVLFHDFPDYLTANHVELCQALPSHLTQLSNIILFATPSSVTKLTDPLQLDVRLDRMEEASVAPTTRYDPLAVLSRLGLPALLDQALETGPTEEVVAHIKYAMCKPDGRPTTFGKMPLTTNVPVVDAVVVYFGNHAAARAASSGPVFAADAADMAALSMILHELSPESRYFFISSMVNQLRYPNAHTSFFGLALLEIFGQELSDPEETDIREQICRVLYERIVNYWPQPWGLLAVITELVRNEKLYFFELPFLKVAPEVSERFSSLLARA